MSMIVARVSYQSSIDLLLNRKGRTGECVVNNV